MADPLFQKGEIEISDGRKGKLVEGGCGKSNYSEAIQILTQLLSVCLGIVSAEKSERAERISSLVWVVPVESNLLEML